MKKEDIIKQDSAYFNCKNDVNLLELGTYKYLKFSSKDKILGDVFNESVNSLFFVTKVLQNILKKQKDINFSTPKLEILKWDETNNNDFIVNDKNNEKELYWIMLIRLYDFITEDHVEDAKEYCIRKKQIKLAEKISIDTYNIGNVVQIMHKGDFGTEGVAVTKMYEFMNKNNLEESGFYQELNLSYPRKVIPQNMKRILRIPVRKR